MGDEEQSGPTVAVPDERLGDERDVALQVVRTIAYVVIASADEQGTPWVSPVYFAADGLQTFYWVSRPERTHSRNIASRPEVALTVFDSTQPPDTGLAVYARATASRVLDAEVPDAIGPFTARSEKDGSGVWDAARLTIAHLALYRAEVTELSLLPGRGTDDRIALDD